MQQPGGCNIDQVVLAGQCAPAIKLETVPLSVRDMQSSGLSDGISNSPGSMLRVVQPLPARQPAPGAWQTTMSM